MIYHSRIEESLPVLHPRALVAGADPLADNLLGIIERSEKDLIVAKERACAQGRGSLKEKDMTVGSTLTLASQ
jgi:hypothetical protein